MSQSLLLMYLLCNVFAFCLYGIDKQKAKLHKWRISEMSLLLAAVFGAIGALAGMYVFHHKTQKAKFFIGVPAIGILELLLIFILPCGR